MMMNITVIKLLVMIMVVGGGDRDGVGGELW